MKHFLELKHEKWIYEKPWLVLGKGPTFEKLDSIEYQNYWLFGLNHVCEVRTVDIGHFIDVEAFSSDFSCPRLLAPWHYHRNCKVSNKTLSSLPVCAYYDTYWYNLSTWKFQHRNPINPVIRVLYFSAEAAFQVLGYLGIKKIYSLGIDGGTEYAKEFKAMGLKSLINKRASFNDQLSMIKQTCERFDIKWTTL